MYFRTDSLLECDGVRRTEIIEFLAAAVEERRRMYIAWKRREVENNLRADQRICARCKVSYRLYANAWNKAGCCSKACDQAHRKSRSKRR